MDGNEGGRQDLFGNDEVADIAAGKVAAGVTIAGFINRRVIVGKGGVHQVDAAVGRECSRMAG
ncbi:hypothetical protein SDC9_152193 [bioreactor metagenome]|uniref:Uncharacterized protein n=1 Tax=bioreactor metagenome TaxID=1076179 RepID=A0A645EWW3_9ZZZZ